MTRETRFTDRAEAGRQLAELVFDLALPDPVVLALPRGGVPVALPIARRLGAPFDLLLVRKIGAPANREYAIGAIVDGVPPQHVIDHDAVSHARATNAYIQAEIERQIDVMASRRTLYLAGRPALALSGRDIVVVDDGIATGSTIRAALQGLRGKAPASITIAVPVGPAEAIDRLSREADRVICLSMPEGFSSVGEHYADFHQLTDDEVIALMAAGAQPERGTPSSPSRSS